jgi:hypothetical protein
MPATKLAAAPLPGSDEPAQGDTPRSDVLLPVARHRDPQRDALGGLLPPRDGSYTWFEDLGKVNQLAWWLIDRDELRTPEDVQNFHDAPWRWTDRWYARLALELIDRDGYVWSGEAA